MVLPGEDLAALVQLAAGDSYIVVLGSLGRLDQFRIPQVDSVHGAHGLEEGDDDGGGRRQSANRKAALNDSAEANAERMAAAKFAGRPPEVVGPVILAGLRDSPHVPLRPLGELE